MSKKRSRRRSEAKEKKPRTFGDFECSVCDRKWRSGKAKENKTQDCRKCNNPIKPIITVVADEPNSDKKNLTPYQGNRRTFGTFKCDNCKKSWSSGYSWADTPQDCKTCKISIYPFQQRKLETSGGPKNPDIAHMSELCGKCKELGRHCNEYRGRRRRNRRKPNNTNDV